MTTGTGVEGKRLIAIEVQARRWATGIGLPTPKVLDHAPDYSWMIATWQETRDPVGSDYVRGALRIADTIMAADLPALSVAASEWSGDSANKWQRIYWLTSAGLPLLAWLRARRMAGRLTDFRTAHGDYYRRNVLATSTEAPKGFPPTGGVSIVDWEFLGAAPAFTDHLRLWSTLREPSDRALALDLIFADASRESWKHLCILAEWLGLRLLAENLSAPKNQRNAKDLAHARIVAREARALGRSANTYGLMPATPSTT